MSLYLSNLRRYQRVFGTQSVPVKLLDRRCPKGNSCAFRDFGYCEVDGDGRSIYFIRKILSLPQHNVVGLIRHELGHAFDAMIDHSGAEQRADDLAEYATGERIYYDERDIQTTMAGTYPRPLWLHR